MQQAVEDLALTGDPHQLLTPDQAAAFLAISPKTLADRRRRGLIHATYLGGNTGIRYQIGEVRRYIAEATK